MRHRGYVQVVDSPEFQLEGKRYQGFVFTVRSRETPHRKPHVHVKHGEHTMSVMLDSDLTIETRKFPAKLVRRATDFIDDNFDDFMDLWEKSRPTRRRR